MSLVFVPITTDNDGSRLKSRLAAIGAALIILALTGVLENFSRQVHQADVRAAVNVEAESLSRNLIDTVARETSAVNALAAFVAVDLDDSTHLDDEFALYAEALQEQGSTIRSIQLAPDSILRFVYPIEGNEAAVGLDLLADPDRRALLEPAIVSGETVIQGPVELVQGGLGLIARSPVYRPDGTFWGFTAVVLDWPGVVALTEFESESDMVLAGARLPGTDQMIAGDAAAFEGDPLLRQVQVGATATVWELGVRPLAGWPTATDTSWALWAGGFLAAGLAGWLAFNLVQRPILLAQERARALRELVLAEARYQVTFEHAGVGLLIVDSAGRVVSANPSLAAIAGFEDAEELVGWEALDLVGAEDRSRFEGRVDMLAKGERMIEEEIRISAEGLPRWCRVRFTMIADEATNEQLFIGIVEDVTDRRIAEHSLAQSEIRFRQLFELAPIAIQREDYTGAVERMEELRASGVTDLRSHLAEQPSGLTELLARVKIIDANPAADALQSHLGSQAGQKTLLDRYTKEAEDTFVDTLVAIWEGRVSAGVVVHTRGADGLSRHLDLRWQAPDLDGRPDYSGVILTIADVTELKEIGRKLQELLKSKDRFVASVAHELRTPLTAVVGFAQELNSEAVSYSPAEKKEFQELIAFHSADLSYIIEDLLVWARGDIDEVSVSAERFDLGGGVRSSLNLVPGSGLTVREPDGRVEAIGDPARLRQIVRNLATNAVRYGGSEVEVEVRRSAGSAIVEVSDNGPEIPPDRANVIFEPYERAETRPAKPGSIGLGLTVSRALARLQGGDVVFFRAGDRNVFRVTLPAADAENPAALVP